jgi:putative tricarboxylic transport membrane protein
MGVMAFMCAFGCAIMIGGYQLGIGVLQDPGAGLMPFIIGAFLCILSLWYLLTGLLRKHREHPSAEQQEPASEPVKYKKISLVIGGLLLYGVLLNPLGFPVATFLFLLCIFWMMGVGKKAALIASALVALANYLGFGYLGLRFPPGLFKFLGFH